MTSSIMDAGSDFPIDWHALVIEGPPYRHDPMHRPFPVCPLQSSLECPAFAQGYAEALRSFGLPVLTVEEIYPNYYQYRRIVMEEPGDDAEAGRISARVEASVRAAVERQMERWQVDHFPRLRDLTDRLSSTDLRNAPQEAIGGLFGELHAMQREIWTIHFQVALPILVSMQLFTELYTDLFGGSEADAQELLAGGVSESLNAAFGLSDLAAVARDHALESVIIETPADQLVDRLEATSGGRVFIEALQRYLSRYGYRQELGSFIMPTWLEEPAYALAAVRTYMTTGSDPRTEHQRVARAAEAAVARSRAALEGYPQPIRDAFEGMLRNARDGAFLQEEHNFHFEQAIHSRMRLLCLQLGERLVAEDILADPEDVFMLDLSEVRALLEGTASGMEVDHARALVRRRRHEMELAKSLEPPPLLGDPGQAAPEPDTPVSRALAAFFGGSQQVEIAAGQVKGTPAARGRASGRARVARSLSAASEVEPGEVLVAVTTMPAWTPLFGVVSAVVTETGGPLSHCAVVAREYGIPAVVGARGAMDAISTGQLVTVDGDAGMVLLEGGAASDPA